MIIPLLRVLTVMALAFASGANDVSKGIATLAGSGRATYRQASLGDSTASAFALTAQTLGQEDTRRSRMDMDLGVWTGSTRRYYPMDLIRQRGEALIDEIDGRKVLVYVDPDTFTPAAVFVNSATARLQNKDVGLDNGQVLRGVCCSNEGADVSSRATSAGVHSLVRLCVDVPRHGGVRAVSVAEAPGSRTQPPRKAGSKPVLKTGRATGPRSLPCGGDRLFLRASRPRDVSDPVSSPTAGCKAICRNR